MSDPTRLKVDIGERGYDIVVGPGLLEDAPRHLRDVLKQQRIFVVTDETVARLHLPRLRQACDAAGIAIEPVVMPPGEGSKDWQQLGRLLEALIERRIERRSTVVALGGGVVGDMAGLAASLVLRGVDYVQAPTTLLAQVDSSVGGKTGVNTRHGKNLVGTFYQPRLVLADLDVLRTLPRRELLSGYAEVVKYGLIEDAAFFAWIEANGARLVEGEDALRRHAVVQSCAAKSAIVAADEREAGRRALLNFGHTFGHALEAATGFGDALLHGEAVAIGMVLAFDLSVELGLCPPADAARVRRHLSAVGLPVAPPRGPALSGRELLALMSTDKKVRDGKVTFVLARGIGQAFIAHEVDSGRVTALLDRAVAA